MDLIMYGDYIYQQQQYAFDKATKWSALTVATSSEEQSTTLSIYEGRSANKDKLLPMIPLS